MLNILEIIDIKKTPTDVEHFRNKYIQIVLVTLSIGI